MVHTKEMNSYGPNLSETYTNNPALIKFMDQCTKYVAKLSEFSRYCVWRYTIGSASINSYLIFGKPSENSPQWAYLFFKYCKNSNITIPSSFKKYKPYFQDPEGYRKLPNRMEIAQELISAYISLMYNIIKSAPRTPGNFHVFKVASPYPGLPKNNNEVPAAVLQLPFNSSTVTPYFNFAPFLSPSSSCCLFDIEVPKGSMCLFVPQEYHAYPFEMEIILPYNCIFNVTNIRKTTLNYVDPSTVKMTQVQPKTDIRMGAVYQLNEYAPCGPRGCDIKRKTFTVYDCIYGNPI